MKEVRRNEMKAPMVIFPPTRTPLTLVSDTVDRGRVDVDDELFVSRSKRI